MKKVLLFTLIGIAGFAALTALFFAIRQGIANAQIEREWKVVPASAPDLKTTTQLEILPLYENDRADESFDFGHGVSYLIRTDSATVLMDLGFNPTESAQPPSLQNMQALGITNDEIDAIVISHPHPDHVGGVQAWRDKTIFLGEDSADLSHKPVYAPIAMQYPGATVIHSAEPTLASADMGTTGVITFPEVFPISLFDPKGHEQGLVVDVAGEGLVLITGCGHPTLERLVSRAETMYGKQVVGVVGGLHYGEAAMDEVQPHIQFLEPRQPHLVALSPHDSGLVALQAFRSAFSEAYQSIRVGETIQFP